MKFGWPLLTFACVFAHPGRAHAEPPDAPRSPEKEVISGPPLASPRAKATLRGPNPSYVGQMVRVEVELLRDDREKDKPAPFFPEVRVKDAIALLSEHAPPPEQLTLNGITYLVQKRIYLIFPQAAGDLTVPKIAVTLPGPDNQDLLASTEPLRLHADIPRGSGARLPLVARNVQLERRIDGDLGQLRVGDAFTVTLKLRATDTDPVLLPVVDLPEVSGLSRYRGESTELARADRGEYVAERTEVATYVASDLGFYQLPRASVFWLDPTTGQYAQAVAPQISFRARINPHLGAGCMGGPRSVGRVGGFAVALVLLALVLRRIGRQWMDARRARARVKKSADERSAFAALRAAAESEHDGATLSALYFWLRYVVHGLPTLRAWLEEDADERLHHSIMSLEKRIVSGGGPGRASDIVAPLVEYRSGHKDRDDLEPRVPELNERPNEDPFGLRAGHPE